MTANDDEVFDGISHADQENGNPERDGYYGRLGAARFALAPAHRFTLDGSLLYKRSRAEIDGPDTLPDGRLGLRLRDDLTAFGIEETWVAQTQPSVAINRRWNSSLQLGFTRNRVATRVGDMPFGFDNRLLLVRWTNDHLLYEGAPGPTGDAATTDSTVSFRWGGEVQQEEGTNQLPDLPLHGARTIYTGLTESQASLGRLSGFAGVRVNHYDDLGTHPTAYGGLAYAATSALTVRASGGNTYRAPAFHELFFIPFSGQPSLEPERSVGADLGIDWSPTPASRLSLTGYYSRLDDLIQLTSATGVAGGRGIRRMTIEWTAGS